MNVILKSLLVNFHLTALPQVQNWKLGNCSTAVPETNKRKSQWATGHCKCVLLAK